MLYEVITVVLFVAKFTTLKSSDVPFTASASFIVTGMLRAPFDASVDCPGEKRVGNDTWVIPRSSVKVMGPDSAVSIPFGVTDG